MMGPFYKLTLEHKFSKVEYIIRLKIKLKLNVLPHQKRLKHFMEPIPKVLFREGRTEPIPNFNLAMDV